MKLKNDKIFFIFLLNYIIGIGTYAQTTIITHGFGAGTSDPINGWMLDMANTIRYRIGDATVRSYNPTTGNFDYRIGSGTQTILLFEWLTASNNFQAGFSEDAGSALFASLMQGSLQGDFSLNQLHFIGHSRGSAVNSEVAERLLVLGYAVEQVTSIDAHDWGGTGLFDDYDCNPSSWQSGVEGWLGLNWADSYWQENLFTLNGRAVDGTYSKFLGSIGHGGIRDWYHETIEDTSIHDGYYYSINGGGSNIRPQRSGLQRSPVFSFADDAIVNGNFERGALLTDKFAGWSYNGGGGNATIDNHYLALKSASAMNKIHNRFYIPPNAYKIQFLYKIDKKDNSNPSPNIDKLIVLLNGNPILTPILMNNVMSNWDTASFSVLNYRNTVKTLEFKLVDENGGNNDINSEVWIDDIKIIIDSTVTSNTESTLKFESNIAPNPFNNNVTIYFSLTHSDFVSIRVYNSTGNIIATLRDKVLTEKGTHQLQFNTQNLAQGLYLFHFQIGDISYFKRGILNR
ncbi:MAG: T9SS type A sorting domain-containing protein [Bacteroidales bacterium]|nr:T9SS type A sorting domain-containing protein [Bacteroidales bacterium]